MNGPQPSTGFSRLCPELRVVMAENCLESDSDCDGGGRCSVKRSDLDGMSPCVAIPAAVASRSGANVLDLDQLTGVVDVDALDEMWEDGGASQWDRDVRLTFPYMGYEVTVTPDEFHLVPNAAGDDGGERDARG